MIMRTLTLTRSQFHLPSCHANLSKPTKAFPIILFPVKKATSPHPKHPPTTTTTTMVHPTKSPVKTTKPEPESPETAFLEASRNGHSRILMLGAAASLGFVMLLLLDDQSNRALALGPEGPLMEEFWDNVRRYAIYALTVSTGAIYTIFLPIVELLKNPISAILVVLIFGGGIYIVSQVLSAMVGVSEFSYDYAY